MIFERGDVHINYEIHGTGFPILLFAPGGMRSAASFWRNSEWDPIETLSSEFSVIAMDQRNAGSSTAPVSGSDDWSTYTNDHIALANHLDIERLHLMGGCIGGPYCFGFIESAPSRVCSAVIQQSIGVDNNQQLFFDMFDQWADPLKPSHPEATEADWVRFRSNMFEQEFLYNVDRDFLRGCEAPLLVLMGSDAYHPEVVSREIADLAPHATLVENWKNADEDKTVERVLEFLHANTP